MNTVDELKAAILERKQNEKELKLLREKVEIISAHLVDAANRVFQLQDRLERELGDGA